MAKDKKLDNQWIVPYNPFLSNMCLRDSMATGNERDFARWVLDIGNGSAMANSTDNDDYAT